MSSLQARWRVLAVQLDFNPAEAEPAFQWLMQCYHEPQRHYHNARHIEALLNLTADHDAALKNRALIELAIWFHDCIYDVMNPFENEVRSAKAAEEWLARLGAGATLVQKVNALILATRNHNLPTDVDDSDGAFFLDADLSILGASAEVYAEYTRQIRTEFSWVPEAGYRAARREAMTGFLRRPRIYRTDLFFEEYETQARKNISEEIERLN